MGALERQRIRQLEAELDEALERIRQLEADVMGEGWLCPIEFGLTGAERRILAALVAQERCSKEFLHMANCLPGREIETEIKIVDVMICKMRRKLEPFGLEILTLWGVGYTLAGDTRERLRAWPPNDAGRRDTRKEAS